jgi:hypothetical protein
MEGKTANIDSHTSAVKKPRKAPLVGTRDNDQPILAETDKFSILKKLL